MAVGATAVEGEPSGGQLRGRGVPSLVVALLAEPGHADFQQLRPGGPVRFMAIHAIFLHRRMFPQERPAPFRMALVAGLVDRALDQQLGIGRSVRIMAIGARDLSFPEGHVRGPLHLRAAHLVALEANLHSRLLDELTIPRQRLIEPEGRNVRLHDLVACHAGQAAGLVRTALPEQPRASLVALQTRGILFRCGQR